MAKTIISKSEQNQYKLTRFIYLGGITIALSGCTQSKTDPGITYTAPSENKPNILFLFTDDQRFNTIGALDYPEIKTPNIDRLVKNGVCFTHAHIMGGTSGAVCMPSRAMLLTGQTIFHLHQKGASIPDEVEMMPETFKNAGYNTYGIGKWHNSRKAYSRSFTNGGKIMFGGMSDHLKVPVYDFDTTGKYPKEYQYTGDKFSSTLFADQAIKFLENDIKEDPFFMYVSFTAPHDPRMAPENYANMYPAEKITLPENFLPEHPFDNGEMKVRDEGLAPWPRTYEIIKQHLAGYYAMITHVDAQIGRILDALNKSGKAENTIIVFAGDNGLAVGYHGLLGKQNLYEHSIRVPLIITGPGIPKGVKTEGLCYLLDIYPTLCELTGLTVPQTSEGKSLLPLLINHKAKIRDFVFYPYTILQRGIRTDNNWKLIKYNVKGNQTTQLFNLNKDPNEITNLADKGKYSRKLNELTKLLGEEMRSLDDFCDLDKSNWGLPDEILEKKTINHLAVGKDLALINPYSPKYPGSGDKSLIDGIRGTTNFKDDYWQAFEGNDLEVVIDMKEIISINRITAGFLQNHDSWIFLPLNIEYAVSADEKDYSIVKFFSTDSIIYNRFTAIKDFPAELINIKARYIRITAKNLGFCPDWHPGAGGKTWIFADEIIIE